jgi:hypothetical protein
MEPQVMGVMEMSGVLGWYNRNAGCAAWMRRVDVAPTRLCLIRPVPYA